ncbi:type VI secretion system baseplate subunit TssF [Chitinophaga sp. sic0106]|uniref:type VI secretion system baseplate subunit TssF n=1 Tax=Chitinophaga sp. sic0106 TaxID=2854785 RepID=UPI001C475BC0|nr:type VI secretion system baseplate subunit TssF [Chitinophaga sp. sic0106]MBV7529399.1 type VI secretion system baseplate subunit TssF [Chitinophaga sp. sic0106]
MQYPSHYTSKDNIRARLMQTAADFWGIRSTTDLDPLVRLLIEALSGELYNLSNDLKNTESRLLNKLAALLTPDLLTAALPAHALMQAMPLDSSELLREERHFVYHPKKENSAQDVFFSPATPTRIYDAHIAYMAAGPNLYAHDSQRGKILTGAGKYLPTQTLYLGIRVNNQLAALENLTFYFNWPHFPFDNEWYRLLSLCTASINGQAITLYPGFPGLAATSSENMLAQTLAFDVMPVITRDVLNYYAPRFLHCDLQASLYEKKLYPAAFTTAFEERTLSSMQEKLLWLEIHFPPAIQLDNLEVYTNAVPVMNRRLHTITHRFKGIGNIIPVKPGNHEAFLSVHQLTDSHGKQYFPVSYNNGEVNMQDAYSVRLGGAERFDSRNAREMINYLFELLRDESAAFSAYGYDFLTDVLKSLQQNLELVEQKARKSLDTMTEATRYVVVKPSSATETMHLTYWTTQHDIAQQLRSGTLLTQFEGSGTRADSLLLLTKPTGGRQAADRGNLLQAYKYGLMTRDRIVTEDDIRNFCRHELGGRITDIKIQRGVMVSPHPKEGLKKTTDILISVAQPFEKEEWEFTKQSLLRKLVARSGLLVTYRLLIQ